MKRVTLIIFIIFIIPVWIVSCNPCGKGGDPGFWTWGDIKIDITNNSGSIPLSENDTISTDFVNFNFQLNSKKSAKNNHIEPFNFSAFGCDPSDPTQKNSISNINFKLKYLSQTDTFLNSLTLSVQSQNYVWPKDKSNFLLKVSGIYNQYMGLVKCEFINPHNSQPTQIIMTGIKENGDSITGISQKIIFK